MTREEIPQFKTLEEEKEYWEERGPFGIKAMREAIDQTIKIKGIKFLMRKGIMVDTDDKDLLLFLDDMKVGLHSQGVVVKVDRELPKHLRVAHYIHTSDADLEKAGYVAWKPLIKEER